MKYIITSILTCFSCLVIFAQSRKTENLVIVTLDGMRWQEVFGGVDPAIMSNKKFTQDSAEMATSFWAATAEERRQKLFPFFWKTIASHGQLYGNRNQGSNVNVSFFFFIFSWVKATVPRYRYDQLMRLGWKVFLPVSLLFVVLVSGYLMATGHFGGHST